MKDFDYYLEMVYNEEAPKKKDYDASIKGLKDKLRELDISYKPVWGKERHMKATGGKLTPSESQELKKYNSAKETLTKAIGNKEEVGFLDADGNRIKGSKNPDTSNRMKSVNKVLDAADEYKSDAGSYELETEKIMNQLNSPNNKLPESKEARKQLKARLQELKKLKLKKN